MVSLTNSVPTSVGARSKLEAMLLVSLMNQELESFEVTVSDYQTNKVRSCAPTDPGDLQAQRYIKYENAP